ncbi:TIGR04552 family protein, partial [bacterium]|nr:TIGR04552 family protein [bacterium]
MQSANQHRNLPKFSWDILSFMLKGDSPIDIPALAIANRTEAQDFLRYYGYDCDNSAEMNVVHDIFAEALGFIKKYFCNGTAHFPQPISVPLEFERIIDIRDLLVIASADRERDRERQLWACAILRVMHTIHHINHELRVEFFPEIKRQVLDNFKRNINYDDKGAPMLGTGEFAVPLYHVFFKEEKERDSVILKLLQKAKNVAEKIHDHLGVKLVTYNKLDALLALRYLRHNNIVMFPNVTPGRS